MAKSALFRREAAPPATPLIDLAHVLARDNKCLNDSVSSSLPSGSALSSSSEEEEEYGVLYSAAIVFILLFGMITTVWSSGERVLFDGPGFVDSVGSGDIFGDIPIDAITAWTAAVVAMVMKEVESVSLSVVSVWGVA